MKRHILTVSILLVAAQLFGQESRFWVGGSGKWSDTNHWSVTSGGEPGAAVPESGTSVVFDENSFSGDKNTVTLKDAVEIGSLTATNADFVFSGKKSFTVSGSINTDANADFGKLRGALVLSGNGSNTVNIASELEGDVIIDGGSWILESDLTTGGDITLKSGSFNTAGHNVTCAVFSATESATALNIENSTITCDKWDFGMASNLTFEAKASVILVRGNIYKDFTSAEGLAYNRVKSYSLAASKDDVVTMEVTSTNITCPANVDAPVNDGTATVKLSGGSASGYSITIGTLDYSTLKFHELDSDWGMEKTFSNLAPGMYNIGFSPDGDGLELTTITITYATPNFNVNVFVPDGGGAKCWGDNITLAYEATGGTGVGTYSQQWKKTGKLGVISPELTISASPQAAYTVTVIDGKGCKYTSETFSYAPWFRELGMPDNYAGGPARIIGDTETQPSCSDGETGVITIKDVSGGTSPYTYKATSNGNTYDFGSNPTKGSLPTGDYTILITDSEGCTNRTNFENVFESPSDYPEEITAFIDVIPAPEAKAGSDDQVCLQAGTYTLSKANGVEAKNYDDGHILWTVDNPSVATIASGADTETPTLNLLAAGVVTLTMEVTNGTCDPVEDYMTLTVIATPKPSITSTDHSVCGLEEDIQAVASMGGTLVADHIGGTGSGTATISNLHVKVDEPGEYIFRVIETEPDNGCVGYSNSDGDGLYKTVTLNFFKAPTVNIAVKSGKTCETTPVTITADIENQTSIVWDHDGNGTLEGNGTKTVKYTPSASDIDLTVTITVVASNGVCADANDAYSLKVNPYPHPTINAIGSGSNGDVCGLTGIIATAVPSHGGNLTWDNGGDNTFIVTPTSATTATLEGDNGVTYGLTVKEEKEGCVSEPSPVVYVTFHDNPTLSLSDPVDVCGTDPATATATATNNTSLSWSKGAFLGTLEQSGDASSMTATYTPDDSEAGKDVTLTATITTAACGTLTENYTFHVYKVPSPALTGKEICGPEDDGYLTATIESGNTVEWNIPSGVTIIEEKIEGTKAMVKLALSGTTYGDYTIGVVESNTNCSSDEVTATVTFKAKPVIEFNAYEATICAGESYTVEVTKHENFDGYVWIASDGGTLDLTEEHKATYNSSLPATAWKQVTITAKPQNGCDASGEKSMTLTVNPKPQPDILPATVCGLEYDLPVAAQSVTGIISNLAWSTTSTEAHVTSTKFVADKEGSFPLRLTEQVGTCESVYDEEMITFVAKPTANAGDDDAVCFNELTYELTATAENYSGLEWSSPTAGVFATDDLNPIYTFTPDDKTNGSVTLTLKAKAKTPCTSSDDYEDQITITINPLPTPTIAGDNNICQDKTGSYSTETGMTDYKWYIDDVEQSGSSNTFSYTWTTAGTFNVKVEYTDGNGCKGVSSAFQVIVRDLPVSGLVSSDNTCTNGSGLPLNATATGGSGTYEYAWTGNGVEYLDDPSSATPIFMSNVAGTYTLTCTITDTDPDYGCSVEATITIENEQGPTVSAGPDTTICYNGTYTLLDGVEFANGTTFEWTTDGDGEFDDETLLNATYKPGDIDKANGEVHLTLTVHSSNCGSISDDMTLTIMPELTIGIGTLKPFSIASSTKISVKVKGHYASAYGLQFYLVSPDGAHKVKLYNHAEDHASAMQPWAYMAGNFDFEFTTTSDVDFYTKMKSWAGGSNASGTFGITGDWSEIYGLNPAEGGWAVEVGSTWSDGVGQLAHAVITFTDVNFEGKTQTLTFDSKELTPAVNIPNVQTISYISPIGLRESCYGKCDAHAVANALGGSGKIVKWEWARDINFTEEYYVGGTYNRDTLDLCRGIYYVRATDAMGCEAVTMVEVGSPDQIHISKDATSDVTCFNGSDGTVTFSATKELISHFDFDVAGYTATSSDDFSASFTTLPFGDAYRVIVTDEDGCQDSLDFQIGEPNKLVITKVDSTLATSCQVDNGSVTFTVTGGAVEGDYHMVYMGLPQDQPNIAIDHATLTATNLAGATGIKFRIYDAATFNPLDLDEGCFVDTTVSTLAEGMELDIATTENTCNGDDGASITVSVSKGSGDYAFEWYDENGLFATTSEPTITDLTAGTYTVKVKDLNTLCDATSDPIVLTDPLAIVITKNITALPKCYGEETASFSITADGGMGNLTYAWQKDGVSIDNATNSFENVGAGEYTVIVSDGFCDAKDTITVVEPTSKLVIVDVVTTESECATPTGTAIATVTGGEVDYTYTWTSLTDGSEWNGPSPVAMGADMYKLVVEDKLHCQVDTIVEVEDNGTLQFAIINKVGVLCLERCTGSAEIGLVYDDDNIYDHSDLLFTWNGVETNSDKNNTLCNGLNTVRVKSITNGCSRVDTFKLSDDRALKVEIHRDPDLSTSGSCNGSITAIGKGGVPGYTYTWADASGNPIEASASEPNTIYLLCEGYYALHIEDKNPDGCAIDTLIQIEHRPLSYRLVQVSATACYGGSDGAIEIEGVGGYYEPYTYKWGSPLWPADSVAEGASITGLKAGKYGFTISQRNGTISVKDTIVVTQPTDSLLAQFVAIGTPCYETVGSISVKNTIGGNAPFTFNFSNDAWTADSVKVSADGKVNIVGLATDNYGMHVVDARGCEYKTIVEVPDLSEFKIELVAQETRCYGENSGEVSVTASSENGGFKYEWVGRTDDTDRITGLVAGTYTVKVTDDKNCVKTDSIEVLQPEKINFSIANTVPGSCYNTTDAEIAIDTIMGRTGSMVKFHFMPDDGSAVCFDSTTTMSKVTFTELLPAGGYKVLAYDAKGCPSDTMSLSVFSMRPKISVETIDDVEPTCYNYTVDGKLSYGKLTVTAIATVTSQVSSTIITDLEQYYQIDGGAAQKAHIFDKVTAGSHTITVGFGEDMDCPVMVDHELGSKNKLQADAAFRNDQKVIFTCPDNELSAYVKSANGTTFSSYKFYALYDEDVENYGKTVEPQPAPAVDTTTSVVDTTANVVDTTANAIAFMFNRGIYYRADSLSNADSTGTPAVDTTSVTPEPVQTPTYNYGTDIRGNKVVLFANGNGSDTEAWADKFLPYGGATYYYFEIADNQCVAIDSIKATSLRPTEKLTATVSMDDATSDELFIAGEYEVPEGGRLILEANQLQFEFDNAFVYSENAWAWDWAPADKLNGEGSGLRYETSQNDNPIVALSFGKVYAKVRDSVAFELSDMVYNIDTAMVCYYYDSVKINSISGIHPADVFTPNGDEYNETWRIEGLAAYDKVTIYVFNRWGGRVWQYSGSGKEYSDANQWNGRNEKNKPVPSGTYYYVIQCSDGILGGKKVTGPVTVIR